MMQLQDAYDGTLVAELETLAEMVRSQGATEVMKDHVSTTLDPAGFIKPNILRHPGGSPAMRFTDEANKVHCPACQEGLVRIIRSDDTVRHVNGDLCKRFHP